MSLDGYIDSTEVKRLPLSNDADFDRVDAVRAASDAILVGAATVRNDNPRLVIRSPARRAERVAGGVPSDPIKVTVTRSGDLDADAQFFRAGDAQKLVYCPPGLAGTLRRKLGSVATVIDAGEPVCMAHIGMDLSDRGVNRLMVEGGGRIHTQFLTAGLADELQLVVAPFFIGDAGARRFVADGCFPWRPDRRATLAEVRQIGDVVLLRYALTARFGAG
jgi:5-amino-6-(5-phosphoribosylamino)uracil reductase